MIVSIGKLSIIDIWSSVGALEIFYGVGYGGISWKEMISLLKRFYHIIPAHSMMLIFLGGGYFLGWTLGFRPVDW
jgi:Na+/citrate or Na+/malate symporter